MTIALRYVRSRIKLKEKYNTVNITNMIASSRVKETQKDFT